MDDGKTPHTEDQVLQKVHHVLLTAGLYVNVNDVIADKNAVTKIMNNSTGLQCIELNGFAKLHWQTDYYPFAYGWCLGLC